MTGAEREIVYMRQTTRSALTPRQRRRLQHKDRHARAPFTEDTP